MNWWRKGCQDTGTKAWTLFIIFLVFTYFLREIQCEWGRFRERGDTKSEADSRLQAVITDPDAGLEPTSHEMMN